MEENHSLDELRKKAHSMNCDLSEEKFSPREIEIIGYYLHRIAASYMSYFTHKELSESTKEYNEITSKPLQKQSNYL